MSERNRLFFSLSCHFHDKNLFFNALTTVPERESSVIKGIDFVFTFYSDFILEIFFYCQKSH